MALQISYYGGLEEGGALVSFINAEVVLSGVDSAQSGENPANAGYVLLSASSTLRLSHGDDPTALPTDQYMLTGTTRILKTFPGQKFSARADNALAPLTLSNSTVLDSAQVNDVVGSIIGLTPGSTPTITDDATGKYDIDTGVTPPTIIVADVLTAGTDTIEITETLAGATGTPRATSIDITVEAA